MAVASPPPAPTAHVRIADAETGDALGKYDHGENVLSVAYSPDGRLIASASDDGEVQLRDAASGARVFDGPRGPPDRLGAGRGVRPRRGPAGRRVRGRLLEVLGHEDRAARRGDGRPRRRGPRRGVQPGRRPDRLGRARSARQAPGHGDRAGDPRAARTFRWRPRRRVRGRRPSDRLGRRRRDRAALGGAGAGDALGPDPPRPGPRRDRLVRGLRPASAEDRLGRGGSGRQDLGDGDRPSGDGGFGRGPLPDLRPRLQPGRSTSRRVRGRGSPHAPRRLQRKAHPTPSMAGARTYGRWPSDPPTAASWRRPMGAGISGSGTSPRARSGSLATWTRGGVPCSASPSAPTASSSRRAAAPGGSWSGTWGVPEPELVLDCATAGAIYGVAFEPRRSAVGRGRGPRSGKG